VQLLNDLFLFRAKFWALKMSLATFYLSRHFIGGGMILIAEYFYTFAGYYFLSGKDLTDCNP